MRLFLVLSITCRELAAVARVCRLVAARIENNLPVAVGLFSPDGHVAAVCDDGVSVCVLAVALEVAPCVAHVAGWTHHGVSGGPDELIVFGLPVCGFLN